MRRFIIYHRRSRNRWRQLQPGVHDDLCARPEVDRAIRYLRDDPSVAGIAVRLGDDLFNLMAAEASDCYEFTFPEGQKCSVISTARGHPPKPRPPAPGRYLK